jgi:uncharacterized membrane protein
VVSQFPNIETGRIRSIDYLRGVALILMAVDHSMYFAGAQPIAESYGFKMPTLGPDLLTLIGLVTNPASVIFFTLAGTSIALFESQRIRNGWTEHDITTFLIKKGCLLIGLDFVIQPFLWSEHQITIDTLTALGVNIILLTLIRRLRTRYLLIVGAGFSLAYPFIVSAIKDCTDGPICIALDVLFQYMHSGPVHVEFPVLARLNLLIVGYIFGRTILRKRAIVSRHLLIAGGICFLCAISLRAIGSFGNFVPFEAGSRPIMFFIMSKQPPSLVFLLFNFSLGALILLIIVGFQNALDKTLIGSAISSIGKAPLFFYVIHLLIYGKLISHIADFHLFTRTWELVVIEFLSGIIVLIPLCHYYRKLRERYPTSILKYL